MWQGGTVKSDPQGGWQGGTVRPGPQGVGWGSMTLGGGEVRGDP